MRKILKWIGITLGGLLLLLALVAGGMILSANARFHRTYDIQPEPLTISTDPESLAIGQHWAEIHCQACHGEDLGGGPFFEDPMLGTVDAPNLTSGRGGVGATNSVDDWVRAIRHGVKQDGTSVFIMPSNDFYYLSDRDLAGIIAYVRGVPPVDREIRPRGFSPMAKLMYTAGMFGDLLYAETIPHDARPSSPPVAVDAAYGEYLVNAHGCRSCHGAELTGMQPPEPGAPFAPNLTLGGELQGWDEADFATALRTGVTPAGRQLGDSMPWRGFSHLTDDEVQAVWLYLQSQPALATAQN